ncbi:unnamed protein product [Lampetra planeri]
MHRSESAEAQHRTRCRAWSDFRRRRTPLSIRRISTTPHGRRGKAGGASGSVGDLVTLRLTFKTPPYARTPPLPCERPDGRRAPIDAAFHVHTFSHRLRLDPNQEPDGRRRIASAGVFP